MAANPLVLSVVLALVSAVNDYFKWSEAPDRVPLWWNIQSEPILDVPKWLGFSLLPVLILLVSYVLYQCACRDSAVAAQGGESKQAVAHLISLPALFLFVVHNFVLLDTFTSPTRHFHDRLLVATVATWLMIWAGYNLQFVAPNHSFGILTPWTLKDDSVWSRTHDHSALILVVFGVALLICAFTVKTGLPLLIVSLVLYFGSGVYLVFYSWFIWEATAKDSPDDGYYKEAAAQGTQV